MLFNLFFMALLSDVKDEQRERERESLLGTSIRYFIALYEGVTGNQYESDIAALVEQSVFVRVAQHLKGNLYPLN